MGKPAKYRLGRSLSEEVGACLLGGHGIPATVGMAAYQRLRERGAFSGNVREEQLLAWLTEPLRVQDRTIRYRFAAQKSRYLAAALPMLKSAPTFSTGKELRNWLMAAPGVGPKTASWIARNWMDADDIAILDIHIMRVGHAVGIFPMHQTVERHYLELEERFLQFAELLDVRASELDAIIWYEMASSPTIVKQLMEYLQGRATKKAPVRHRREPVQTALLL
jgi:thermostable 8-oxoguanine DNA glycosylase